MSSLAEAVSKIKESERRKKAWQGGEVQDASKPVIKEDVIDIPHEKATESVPELSMDHSSFVDSLVKRKRGF